MNGYVYLLWEISCSSYFRAVVHIQVKDVNEFAPIFKETSYKATVTEGKIYDSVLQVEAMDEDCSPQYSQICNYEIVTTDVPFAIDRNGECLVTQLWIWGYIFTTANQQSYSDF